MISRAHCAGALLAGLLVCSLAGAQARGGSAAAPAPGPHAGVASRVAMGSRGSGGTRSSSNQQAGNRSFSSRRAFSGNRPAFLNSPRIDRFSPAPLSDAPGFAAVGGLAGRDSFSHFGHRDRDRRDPGFLAPILFGSPYYYDDLSGDQPDQQAEQPPQPEGPDATDANQAQAGNSGGDAASAPAPAADSRPPDPVPDIGNFIFVRRDGSILMASAFSVIGEQLRYITPDGIRHTLPISDLNTEATEQMNEARGTTVQLHD